jgi:hypothetical protein
MRAEDLREFARRPRDAVQSAKREHWRAVAQTQGGLGAFDAGQELYEHAESIGALPNAAYRAADLEHHIKLKQLLDRASQAAPFARAAR